MSAKPSCDIGLHMVGCAGCCEAFWCDCATGEDCPYVCSLECEEAIDGPCFTAKESRG